MSNAEESFAHRNGEKDNAAFYFSFTIAEQSRKKKYFYKLLRDGPELQISFPTTPSSGMVLNPH